MTYKCAYCECVIKDSKKMAFINQQVFCSKCFSEIKGWNPKDKKYKDGFVHERVESIRKKYSNLV